jgi:hypothetical protein
MADKNVRLRIGAAMDADMGATVFAPLVAAAKRAAKQIRDELNGAMSAGGRGRTGDRAGGPYRTPGGPSGAFDPTARAAARRADAERKA